MAAGRGWRRKRERTYDVLGVVNVDGVTLRKRWDPLGGLLLDGLEPCNLRLVGVRGSVW